MQKKWQLLFATAATVWLLGACGNDSEESEKPSDQSIVEDSQSEVDSTIEENNGDSNIVEKDEETSIEESTTESTESTESTQSAFLQDAQLTVSEEQGYAMLVLPAYSLTGEEPGKDSLLLKENGYIFMRIETVPRDEAAYSFLLENMKELVSASANGVQPEEVTEATELPQGEEIEDAKGYTVSTATGHVTGILFKRDDILVRLTIFDSLDKAHYKDFIQMGQTIELN